MLWHALRLVIGELLSAAAPGATAALAPKADQAPGEHLRLAGPTDHRIPEPLTLQNLHSHIWDSAPFVGRVSGLSANAYTFP